jgi:hypothetical protein
VPDGAALRRRLIVATRAVRLGISVQAAVSGGADGRARSVGSHQHERVVFRTQLRLQRMVVLDVVWWYFEVLWREGRGQAA